MVFVCFNCCQFLLVLKTTMTKDLTNRYSYVEYIILANILVFAFTII